MIWIVCQRMRPPVSHSTACRRYGSLCDVQLLAGGEGVEVAGDHVEAVLVLARWRPAARAARARAAAPSSWSARRSGARRRSRTRSPSGTISRKARRLGAGRCHSWCAIGHAAHEADGVVGMRRPGRHARRPGHPLDHVRPRRLLQHDEVGVAGAHDVRDRRPRGRRRRSGCCSSAASGRGLVEAAEQRQVGLVHDVLAEEHDPVPRALDVHRPPGHLHQVLAQGQRAAGAMSGCSSPSGLECTPGM